MEAGLRSDMREAEGGGESAAVVFTGENTPFLLSEPEHRKYPGSKVDYVVESFTGKHQYLIVTEIVDEYEVLPLSLLRNTDSNDLLLVHQPSSDVPGTLVAHLIEEDVFSQINSYLSRKWEESGSFYPEENYREHRLTRNKLSGRLAIQLEPVSAQEQALKTMKPAIRDRSVQLGKEANLNRKNFSLLSSQEAEKRRQGYKITLGLLGGVGSKELLEAKAIEGWRETYQLMNGAIVSVKNFDEEMGGLSKQRDLARKAVFASLFDQKLELGLVPPTTFMKGSLRRVLEFTLPDGFRIEQLKHGDNENVQKDVWGNPFLTPVRVFDFILNTERRDNDKVFYRLNGQIYVDDNSSILASKKQPVWRSLGRDADREKMLQMFFYSKKIWEVFKTTDWVSFFDGFFSSYGEGGQLGLMRLGFLERIDVVKKEVNQLIGNGEADFFQQAKQLYESSILFRYRSLYDYVDVHLLTDVKPSPRARLVDLIDVNSQVLNLIHGYQ
ncbi:MAG: hypothetical protein ACPG5T_03165, partial [Endozoicomonas sp.]